MKLSERALVAYRKSRRKPLGEGSRFKALSDLLAARGAKYPRGLAAYIGRKKYGKRKFQKLAEGGRR